MDSSGAYMKESNTSSILFLGARILIFDKKINLRWMNDNFLKITLVWSIDWDLLLEKTSIPYILYMVQCYWVLVQF